MLLNLCHAKFHAFDAALKISVVAADVVLLLFFPRPVNEMIKCTELLHKNLFYDFTRQLSATLPFSWPFNLLVQSVRCVLSPSPALFSLHLVPFDPILCYFFWSWFKVWSPRSHLITNKFVWLFHCSHLAFIHTHLHTHTQQARHAACLKTPAPSPSNGITYWFLAMIM